MQRYFCNKLDNNKFTLSDDDSLHIEYVMRMKIGDLVEIVYDHETYISVIESFHPVTCSINKKTDENNEMNKKIDRWQRIVKEASEQSKRNIIPEVKNVMNINELINYKADLKLICSTINDNKLKNVIREHHNYDTIMLVIGPEGGFDPHEEEMFINNGFIPVSLGKRILRTETASLCALSQLNYEWW